ncbi:hypothetical protein QJS10_CPB20g01047 [Acorus calamus]|uniref:Carotenoid cleavage dioxygenase 4 n=1 Tax=Acorus calamus TaxID=4465 RepID=A0AAV9CDU4_ACOCL|nr:hypothetical protein QJS10_CPB20g01047 [Acorus calamus]
MSLCFLTRHPIITTRTTIPPCHALPLNSIISSSGEKPAQSLPSRRSTSSSHAPPILIIPTTKTKQPQRRAVSSSIPVMVCDALDQAINKYMEPPLSPSMDPNHVLAGNFSPLDELPPTDCPDIDGEVPACLDGAYIRNGPNPQHYPRGPHHLFDGDGMLHCLRISRGRASLCSRYVRTYKYNLEHEAGSRLSPISSPASAASLGSLGLRSPSLAPSRDSSTQGTVLASPTPVSPSSGAGSSPSASPTSLCHPPVPGRWRHHHRRTVRLRQDSVLRDDCAPEDGPRHRGDVCVPIHVRAALSHVFHVRRRRHKTSRRSHHFSDAAFVPARLRHHQEVRVVFRHTDGGEAHEHDSEGRSPHRVRPGQGDEDRGAPQVRDGRLRDEVVRGAGLQHRALNQRVGRRRRRRGDRTDSTQRVPIEHMLASMDLIHCSVEKVRIDLKSGTVMRTQLSEQNLDMGVVNPAFLTKTNRYAYMGLGEPMPKMSGVVKLDLELGKTVATRLYGPGCYGGEPQFVPDVNNDDDEDEGYVVSYVHDEVKGESSFLVMDSKSPNLDVVASVKLPRRVPYGFHGLFISEDDLYKRQHPQSISSSSSSN